MSQFATKQGFNPSTESLGAGIEIQLETILKKSRDSVKALLKNADKNIYPDHEFGTPPLLRYAGKKAQHTVKAYV